MRQQDYAYHNQQQQQGSRLAPQGSSQHHDSSQGARSYGSQQQYQQQAASQQHQHMPMQVQPPPRATPSPLTGEYVYFDRSTAGMRKDTLEKAQAAKLKLEHFYQKAVGEAIERNGR